MALAPAALGVIALAVLVYEQFPAGGNDDSHITYFAAHALSTLGRVVNYNGVAVEQSSSFTLVVLLALLNKITGLSLPSLGWGLSLAFAVLALALVPRFSSGGLRSTTLWSGLMLGTWLPFAYWSTSGMEMTLVGALGCLTVLLASRVVDAPAIERPAVLGLGAAMLAFAFARPETPIELVCLCAVLASAAWIEVRRGEGVELRRRAWRSSVLLAVAVGLTLSLFGIRYLAFGTVVPHPAVAKSGAFELGRGVSYLETGFFLSNLVLPIAALIGAVLLLIEIFSGRASTRLVLVLGWGLSAIAFVAGSGGDWMPGARLLAPAGPALVILAGHALEHLGRRAGAYAHVFGAGLVALNVARSASFGESRSNGSYRGDAAFEGADVVGGQADTRFAFSELANRAHRRDAKLLAPLLDIVRRARPTPARPLYLMSGQAGMVPYHVVREFYGSVRFIDLYGLTTPEVLPCIPSEHRVNQLQGIRISPTFVVEHGSEMKGDCHGARPHVVYSTGRFPDYLIKRGYRKLYQGPREMEAFIAVDEKLFSEVTSD